MGMEKAVNKAGEKVGDKAGDKEDPNPIRVLFGNSLFRQYLLFQRGCNLNSVKSNIPT